jgi:hypothetical protein
MSARPARTAGAGALTQVYLGLVWLLTSSFTAHATYAGDIGLSGALDEAALALPGVLGAMLFTCASIATAATARLGAMPRLLLGILIGVVGGATAFAAFSFGYGGPYRELTGLGGMVVLAGAIGGIAAALPGPVVEAVLWATTWVFFAGVIFGVLGPTLADLLGGADSGQAPDVRIAYGQSALTGVIAGLATRQFARRENLAWAWAPAGGALPGVVLLVAELLARAGGATWSGATPSSLTLLSDAARLRHALIVLAVGALVSGLAGRRKEAAD